MGISFVSHTCMYSWQSPIYFSIKFKWTTWDLFSCIAGYDVQNITIILLFCFYASEFTHIVSMQFIINHCHMFCIYSESIKKRFSLFINVPPFSHRYSTCETFVHRSFFRKVSLAFWHLIYFHTVCSALKYWHHSWYRIGTHIRTYSMDAMQPCCSLWLFSF